MQTGKLIFVLLLTTIVLPHTKAWRRRRCSCPGCPRCPTCCDSSSCVWIWGPCSRTCGTGYQNPVVIRKAGPCGACTLPSQRICNTECCPVNCIWGSWSSYSSCSASCEGGISVSEREYNVSDSCGGSPCTGCSARSMICNSGCCPVDCEWTQWTAWDDCPKAQGKSMTKRNRSVAIHNSCGGVPCQGDDEETKNC